MWPCHRQYLSYHELSIIPWDHTRTLVLFTFLLFLGMVMYANEVETKEK